MEAKVIAFGSCCHDLLPIISLVDKIGIAVGIKKPSDNNSNSSTMNVTIHKDNLGALIRATTQTSSVYSLQQALCHQTIWFCKKIIE